MELYLIENNYIEYHSEMCFIYKFSSSFVAIDNNNSIDYTIYFIQLIVNFLVLFLSSHIISSFSFETKNQLINIIISYQFGIVL